MGMIQIDRWATIFGPNERHSRRPFHPETATESHCCRTGWKMQCNTDLRSDSGPMRTKVMDKGTWSTEPSSDSKYTNYLAHMLSLYQQTLKHLFIVRQFLLQQRSWKKTRYCCSAMSSTKIISYWSTEHIQVSEFTRVELSVKYLT